MRTCEYEGCSLVVFGTCKVTGKGFCHRHQFARLDTDKRSILQKAQDKAKQAPIKESRVFVRDKEDMPVMGGKNYFGVKSDKELATIERNKKHELNNWFKWVAETECDSCGTTCWNCGCFVGLSYIRAATAHIIPKREVFGCPSVATHPYNYLILGAVCGCHQKYDRSWDDASKMKVWELAKERFSKFANEIALDERRNIPEQLR